MKNILDYTYIIDKVIKYLYEYKNNEYITAQMQHKLLLEFALCKKSLYSYINIVKYELKKEHVEEFKITINKTDSKDKFELTDKNLLNVDYIKTTCNRNKYLLYLYNLVHIKNIAYKKHVLKLDEYKSRVYKKKENESLKELIDDIKKYNNIKNRRNMINTKFRKRDIPVILTDDIKHYIKYNIGNINKLVIKYEFLIKNTNYLISKDEKKEYTDYNDDLDKLHPYIKKKIILIKASSLREKNIKEELKKYNLNLRNDSVLCNNYIKYNIGNVEQIASIMNEMNFYYNYTIYPQLIQNIRNSEKCKNIALNKYCKTKFKNYSEAIVSPIIPTSLYDNIKSILL